MLIQDPTKRISSIVAKLALTITMGAVCIGIIPIHYGYDMPCTMAALAQGTDSQSLAQLGLSDAFLVSHPTFAEIPKIGHTMLLNGASQYAESPTMTRNLVKDYTVATLVDFNALGSFQTMVSQDGIHVSGFYLQKIDDDRFSFSIIPRDDSSANPSVVRAYSTTIPIPGRWYSVIGVKSGNIIKLYINGKLEGTSTILQAWNAEGPMVVGRASFDGMVDFVDGAIGKTRVWQRALSAAEIAALAR